MCSLLPVSLSLPQNYLPMQLNFLWIYISITYDLFLYQPKGHEKVSHVLFDIQRVIGIAITYWLEQKNFDKNKFKQNVVDRVRSCDSSTFIRCTPISIWSLSKESWTVATPYSDYRLSFYSKLTLDSRYIVCIYL